MQNTTLFDTNSNEVVPNKELVKITQAKFGTDEVNAVDTRELYKELDLGQGQYSRWAKTNILDNNMLRENADYIGVRHNVEGNDITTYIVTLDVAKHLCMMSRTETAHRIRQYFIECEKNLKKHQLPQTYAEALMELALAEKEKERLALENQTKQKTIDLLTHTNKTYTITEIAKELNMSSAIDLIAS